MEYKKKKETLIQKKDRIVERKNSNSLDDNRTTSVLQRKLFELGDQNAINGNSIQMMEDLPINNEEELEDETDLMGG